MSNAAPEQLYVIKWREWQYPTADEHDGKLFPYLNERGCWDKTLASAKRFTLAEASENFYVKMTRVACVVPVRPKKV